MVDHLRSRRGRLLRGTVDRLTRRAGLGFAETGCVIVHGEVVSTAPAATLLAGSGSRRAFPEGLT